ncbi:MAG TPA: sulfotransferase [Caulobacteraceae bacterium]|jgi:tetratricopeptide (TPR) repeat protein
MREKARSPRRRPGPKDPAGASRLLAEAAAHMAAGRLAEAATSYARAERADPADFRAPISLATVDLRQGRPEQALPRLRRAAELKPDLLQAWANLGAVAQVLELWDEAARAYGRALELSPDAVEARRNYAIVLAVLGRIDEAEVQHRRLAEAPATRLWALTRLALLRPETLTDAELGDMQAAAKDADADADTRIGLQFALGEALERRGRDEAAWAAFAAGNRLQRAQLAGRPASDPARLLELHRRSAAHVRAAFTAERLSAGRGLGLSTAAPIFVVGMPRSGSTLIEQILSSHPDVRALGETAILPRLLEGGAFDVGGAGARRDQAALRALGRRYLDAARARGWRGAGRFVDKTLENYLHVGAIALMFPNAVILHAVRDPVDACVSCWRQLFAEGAETLYDLAEIGAEYVVYRQTMDHWRAALPGRVVDVDHEALVAAPESRIRWLVTEAAGLGWNDACLAFHQAGRAAPTASAAQVRQPIFTTSIDRWRRYADRLGPLFEALGPYAPPRA